jgi:hypothetical protein
MMRSSNNFAGNQSSRRLKTNQRALFALFIKILLKTLKRSGEDMLVQQVRAVVSTCTRRNRMGDLHFSPLEEVLELYLQQMVGEAHWQKARHLQRAYLERRYLSRRQVQPLDWSTMVNVANV